MKARRNCKNSESSFVRADSAALRLDHEDVVQEDDGPRLKDIEQYFQSPEGILDAGDPSSRAYKSARKGLPERENLCKLARVWLEKAHEQWPDLVEDGIVPPLNDATIDQAVEDFQARVVRGRVERFDRRPARRMWKALAMSYLRYSCDHSNPRSLDDQLAKQMVRAKEEGRFIPWEYVFADASVTGRTHLRRGYALAKRTLQELKDDELDTLYFDDFGRVSREAVESYRLAKLMERLRKRLIGVSDGFDLASPAAEVQLMATAMFNEMFIKQLRQKVLRGMKGAAGRGTNIGRPRFGYKLTELRNAAGELVVNEGKGYPLRVPEIDQDAMQQVLRAANWFADEHRSYGWISRKFNEEKIGGRNSWCPSAIKGMLTCPLYIGVRIYNRARTTIDFETGKLTYEPNPRREWVIKRLPHLRAWPDELWKKVQRRAAYLRAHSSRSGRPFRRNDSYPSMLLSGTLECGCCHRDCVLVRSAGRYQQYACPNGFLGKNGCTFTTSKSARIVDNAVLEHISKHILNRESIQQLVLDANRHLQEETQRPRIPTKPTKDRLNAAMREEKRLATFVLAHQERHDLTAYLKKGDELRKQIRSLQRQFQEAEAANAAPPPPLNEAQVEQYLEDIRGLLSQNVEKSAALLRNLFGKIIVQQSKIPGKTRPVWHGIVSGDTIAFMTAVARERDCPFRDTLEFLCRRKWTKGQTATIPLNLVRKFEKLVENPDFLGRVVNGTNVYQIAKLMNLPLDLVSDAVRYQRTGEWPKPERKRPYKKKPKNPPVRSVPKYIQHATEVARLRDEQKQSICQIGRTLKLDGQTVLRAYHYHWREFIRQSGELPKSSHCRVA